MWVERREGEGETRKLKKVDEKNGSEKNKRRRKGNGR